MKNVMKNLLLCVLALIVPVCLIWYMGCVANTIMAQQFSLCLIFSVIGCVVYQFDRLGHQRRPYREETFIVSLIVAALLTLLYTAVVTLYCWYGYGVVSQPYAFVPLVLSVAYCCFIGMILGLMVLHRYSRQITNEAKGLVSSVVGALFCLTFAAVLCVIENYTTIMLPEGIEMVIIIIGALSIVSLIWFIIKISRK